MQDCHLPQIEAPIQGQRGVPPNPVTDLVDPPKINVQPARKSGLVGLSDDYDDGLLATAGPIMLGAYLATLLIAAFTFWNSRATLLSIAICAVYLAMFFGVPFIMARIRNAHDTRWRSTEPERTNEQVEIFTGTIHRNEALLQMIIVPVCIVFAFASFSVIVLLQAP